MTASRWRFTIEGRFLKAGSLESKCEAIVESGVRLDGSPFRLWGVGRRAVADEAGRFQADFVTDGSSTPIAAPETVVVFVRLAKAKWKPIVVDVPADAGRAISSTEMTLQVGAVELSAEMEPYVADA